MFRPISLFALLTLLSCNRAEDRLDRLQHDFWEHFGRQDYFAIQLPDERLLLPLPPHRGQHGDRVLWAKELLKSAQNIPVEALSLPSQTQLHQLKSALEDLVHRTDGVFFDPSRCGLSHHLLRYGGQPCGRVLLEHIPAYYAEVERRWQTPDVRFVPKAVEEALGSLEILSKNEGETEAARWAVKDFIGLCQSAAVLR